jgi:hypothetical protein
MAPAQPGGYRYIPQRLKSGLVCCGLPSCYLLGFSRPRADAGQVGLPRRDCARGGRRGSMPLPSAKGVVDPTSLRGRLCSPNWGGALRPPCLCCGRGRPSISDRLKV